MAIAAGPTESFQFCCQGARRDSLPALLAATTWVEFRDSLDDSAAFQQGWCAAFAAFSPDPTPAKPFTKANVPYRGLRVFDGRCSLFLLTRTSSSMVFERPASFRGRPTGQSLFRLLSVLPGGKSSLARAGPSCSA